MFYRVRARVRRGEATVRVLVLPADVTALVALGALYLDTGQFLLYVFVLHDQLKVDRSLKLYIFVTILVGGKHLEIPRFY